ncbi:MAG TPA: hypothetical protein VHW01_29745, partial [Polyangiaceae bacterium]|nr:hypothetical protein [Polyangiaceae bacterium]
MIRLTTLTGCSVAASFALALACSASDSGPKGVDTNHDNLADDLGSLVDANHDGHADSITIGMDTGPEVNFRGMTCVALDTDCDGIFDSLDCNGDGVWD